MNEVVRFEATFPDVLPNAPPPVIAPVAVMAAPDEMVPLAAMVVAPLMAPALCVTPPMVELPDAVMAPPFNVAYVVVLVRLAESMVGADASTTALPAVPVGVPIAFALIFATVAFEIVPLRSPPNVCA